METMFTWNLSNSEHMNIITKPYLHIGIFHKHQILENNEDYILEFEQYS